MKSKLRINKLILEGEKYKRTLIFEKNLIVIKGDGFSGKSLVLKLIAYCLGGKSELIDLEVQKELSVHCNEAFLEISINNNKYTFNRHFRRDKNIVNIYLCEVNECKDYAPWRKSSDEANEFLAKEMQIPLHNILRRKPGSKDLHSEKISFRDFMRYIYIRQGDLGTSHFMKYDNSFIAGKNKEVFKIINSLLVPDLEEIKQLIQIKQNEKNRLEMVNGGMLEYLKNRNANLLPEIMIQKKEYDQQIKNLNKEKSKILSEMITEDNQIFAYLKKDIYDIETKIMNSNRKIAEVKLSILNKEELIKDYKIEQEKLEATLEIMKKIKIKEHTTQCPLCQSLIEQEKKSDEVRSEDLEQAITNLGFKINMLVQLLDEEKCKLGIFEEANNKQIEKKSIYEEALRKYRENMELPSLAEIEALNVLIKNIRDERNKINSIIDIYHDVEINQKLLEDIGAELSSLEKKKTSLEKLKKREGTIFTKLNEKYRCLMKRFKFENAHEETCYIDIDTFLPYYNDLSILKHTSGCLLLCMEIAYVGAILEVNKDEEDNCHPMLLMLDTVSNNIGTNLESQDSVDPETYNELVKYLGELATDNQVFIVDNTPPDIQVEKQEYIFRRVQRGEALKGLIDEEKNEFELGETDD